MLVLVLVLVLMLVHALSFPKMVIAFPVIAVQAVSDSVSSPFLIKKISNATSLHFHKKKPYTTSHHKKKIAT